MMKRCHICHISKQKTDFYSSKSQHDGYQSYCKDCSSKRRKQYYVDNREKEVLIRKKLYKQNKKWFNEYKKKCSCEQCGEKRWYVLDFHHKGSKESKRSEVANLIRMSKQVALLEIAKCQVLCSNCHRELHHFERLRNKSRDLEVPRN